MAPIKQEPVRGLRFEIGTRPSLRNQQERNDSRALDDVAPGHEPPPEVDRLTFVPTRREAAGDGDAIKLPHFEPVPGDLDEAPRSVSVRGWIDSPPAPKRSRRARAWLTGLLLMLVALQAVPTFLWLRDRVEASLSKRQTTGESTKPGVSPQVAGQPAASPAGKPSLSPVPTVGTGAVPSEPSTSSGTGHVSVAAPMAMQVFVQGRLVGSTQAGPLALPLGRHELEFVSAETGYRASRRVTVRAGVTTRVQLAAPMGLLSINATPWADVYLDKRLIGQTPIGNFKVPIGRRQLTFRHPKLGERRVSVVVKLKEPARVAVDLNKR